MIDKERILKISELNNTKISQLDEKEMAKYTKDIDSFIDNFPPLEDKVKDALRANDIENLKNQLIAVSDMLRPVYADKIAGTIRPDKLNNSSPEDLQTFVIELLKSVCSLSIDLQMAR